MKGRAFNRLERVLQLEKKNGFTNKAVVGGVQQFATHWLGKAREEAIDEADKALVEQIGTALSDYGTLSGPEAREQSLHDLLEKINQRRQRVGESAEKPAPKPAQKQKPQREAPPRRQKTAPGASTPQAEEKLPKSSKWHKLPKIDMKTAVPDPVSLAQPVTKIKGVGPKIGTLIEKLGPKTIWDLLYFFPRRHDDYTRLIPIQQLQYGDQVTVIGTIWETRARRTRNNQVVVQSVVSDGTAKIQATWFNQPWLADKLPAGSQIVLSGKVDQYLGRLVLNSPEWEPLEMDPLKTRRIVPVYPLTQGLSSNRLRDFVRTAVYNWVAKVPDPVPAALLEKHNLFPLPQAIQQQHFPESHEALHHARRRLVFDEHFLLQLGMQTQRQEWQATPATAVTIEPVQMVRFRNALAF